MAKRIVIREIEPIEITFRDKTLSCVFNNDALMLFDELYGDIAEAAQKSEAEPYSYAAKLLYCGIYPNNPAFTEDEAKSIVVSGGKIFMIKLFNELAESLLVDATDDQKKTYLVALEEAMKAVK